ncbi:MAG: class I adenylate-forming enzyme family protein [Immundisolibacterales bacterium]|nr:class I adenylate-forming enzyme family protein [Immundisolibacterales bacterium]
MSGTNPRPSAGHPTHDEAVADLTAPGAEFELATETIRGVEYTVFRNLPTSLRGLYDQARQDHGEKDFLVFEDTRLTYGEAHARAAAIAHQLFHRYGVEKGDRVAIGMRNCPEWVIAFMAITSCGAICVSLNGWWSGEELEYGLEESGARLAFLDRPRHERLADRLPRLRVDTIGARWDDDLPEGVVDFDRLRRDAAGEPMPDVELTGDDDLAILFTSGTTGFPKGAVSTHRAVLLALATWRFYAAVRIATGWLEAPEENPEFQPSILLPVPLFHVTGSHIGLLSSLGVGRKIVMMRRWDPEVGLDLIERERVTSFLGVPTMTWEMLHSPSLPQRDLRSLVAVTGGGAPNPGGMMERLQERMPDQHWSFGWGMTESNAGGTSNSDEDLVERPDSCGRPSPIVEFKVIDRDGNELPPGGRGELIMKSPTNMRCYWRQPEATAETIRDGWLRTGDIAEIDEEGYVFIRDRVKEMVLRGGENIYCAEIERVVYLHPAVFEAAAFGVPDERLGEELAVAVMRRPGAELDPAAVRAHVAEHLARFKVPRYVWLRDEPLPRGSTGKIHKRVLRDRMLHEEAVG